MNIHKEQDTGAGFSPALMEEVTRAAALQGISEGELLRRAAHFYSRRIQAKRRACPLLKPAAWREFRIDDNDSVSFRVSVPYAAFMRAAFIEANLQELTLGRSDEDVCRLAEQRMISALLNIKLPRKSKEVDTAAYLQYLEKMKELAEELERMDA